MYRRRALLTALSLALPAVISVTGASATAAPTPDPREVVRADDADLVATDRWVVEFEAKADLAPASAVEDFASRGKEVLDALRAAADGAQGEALALIRQAGAQADAFWIRNTIVVEGDQSLADRLAALPGVSDVRRERIYPLIEPVKPDDVLEVAQADPEWNIARIRADQAWSDGVVGGGIVIGGVDSGVDVFHPALSAQYRGNLGGGVVVDDYNWYDPTGFCGDSPCDNVGHGTHTMGTILGGDGPGPFAPDIGVAPGARWIASKGCEDLGCSESALLAAGQFMLAPTDVAGENPDPDRRPDIVSNSWGGWPGDPFYQDIVSAWRAVGIVPVFSSGNPGPACGDGGSPGDYPEAISVGATDMDDIIAEFSGRGPSVFGKVNPNVSAPGVDIVSSVPGGGYEAFSGTSMAAPAVAGTVALMLSAAPELIGRPSAVQAALEETAVDIVDLTCGGADDGDPNNVYGEGRIDAKAAVDLVVSGGVLDGTVVDASNGSPIPGARVSASDGDRDYSTFTDEAGRYRTVLAEGSYTVSASQFGYVDGVVPDVQVVADTTTTQDLALTPVPIHVVRGRVRAAENGRGVAHATVTVTGAAVAPVVSDDRGFFRFELPEGRYTLTARAGGCTDAGTADVVVDSDRWVPIDVTRKIDDFGHGCRPTDVTWRRTTNQTSLYGDDSYGRLRLPFEFPFYGDGYRTVFPSTNGFLSFEDPLAPWIGPGPFPSSNLPNAAIYPLWSDLVLGPDSESSYSSGGRAPNRWFAISWIGATQFGDGGNSADFQVRLWEDGTIDMVYRDNEGAPGDGSTAAIGIEAPDGTDALSFSFREAVVEPDGAYRFELVPTGVVTGVVTDANDGLPIAGADVSFSPGDRGTTTDADGRYSLRLLRGRYTMNTSAPGYENDVRSVRVVDGMTRTIDVALAAPSIEVAPTEISGAVEFGETIDETVTVTNVGTADLDVEVRERDRTRAPELPAEPAGPDGEPIVRSAAWEQFTPPTGSTITTVTDLTFDGPLDVVIDDPDDDAIAPPELTQVRGGADDNEISIQLDFAASPVELGGYLLIDADRDISTGVPPEWWSGLPTQELGVDYVVDLFATGSGVVLLFDAETFELIAELPSSTDGNSVRFDLPVAAMEVADDGVDLGAVVGDFFQPTDWAPDAGKGTIEPGRDAPWMSADPVSAIIAPGDSVDVTVTLGGVDPGEYVGQLLMASNDPRRGIVPVDVSLTVTVPAGYGEVIGTVTNARTGGPVAASVEVAAELDGVPAPIVREVGDDGALRLFGPAGTWPVTVSADGYATFTGELTIPDGGSTEFDVALVPLWPVAVLDGGPIEIELEAGSSATTALTLGEAGGLAELEFSIHEIAAALDTAARSLGATSGEVSADGGIAVDARIDGAPTLIIEDVLPWGYPSIEEVLDGLGAEYDIAGSADLPGLDLSGYGAVFVANDQTSQFYEVLAGQIDQLAEYAEGGGFLWLGVAGWGWNGGEPAGLALPGGGSVAGPVFEEVNLVADPAHPLVAGLPAELFGSFASHAVVEGQPAGSTIVTTPAGDPTVVEYALGAGRVVVVAMPVEWGWLNGEDSGIVLANGAPYALAFEPFTDLPWLDVQPAEGVVPAGDTTELTVTVDATDLAPGAYEATLMVLTNDPLAGRLTVPVSVVVTEAAPTALRTTTPNQQRSDAEGPVVAPLRAAVI